MAGDMESASEPLLRNSIMATLRRRNVFITVVSVPILLIIALLVVFLIPGTPDSEPVTGSYVVIFDAGSSGTRVHVYRFDGNMNLVPVPGTNLTFYNKTEPGLSDYAKKPGMAGQSLGELLEQAESYIPKQLRSKTPVRVGATAGLRLLEDEDSDRILDEVRDYLAEKSSLKVKCSEVKVLKGIQEGSYMWLTINYALDNLGKDYKNTVGVIDLGGASVQMAYAIDGSTTEVPPVLTRGDDKYVNHLIVNQSTTYDLYVHSYLKYGINAARVEILEAGYESNDDMHNPCLLTGYNGNYEYNGVNYTASATNLGANRQECRKTILKALKINETCPHEKCTFGGIWNGGRGGGQDKMYLASAFYWRAYGAGISNRTSFGMTPIDFGRKARIACNTTFDDVASTFPRVRKADRPYICMDLTYAYTLLVDGFGLDPSRTVTVVKEVEYINRKEEIEAAWPLGSAIELFSKEQLSLKIFSE